MNPGLCETLGGDALLLAGDVRKLDWLRALGNDQIHRRIRRHRIADRGIGPGDLSGGDLVVEGFHPTTGCQTSGDDGLGCLLRCGAANIRDGVAFRPERDDDADGSGGSDALSRARVCCQYRAGGDGFAVLLGRCLDRQALRREGRRCLVEGLADHIGRGGVGAGANG